MGIKKNGFLIFGMAQVGMFKKTEKPIKPRKPEKK